MRTHLQRFSQPHSVVLISLMAIFALSIAACGGGASTAGTTGSTATATATTAATDTPIPPAATATNTPSGLVGAATISMGFGDFSGNTSVTIKAGQAVTFDDSTGGGHNLVTGTGGTYSQEVGAPAEFTSSGIMFNAGDKKTITFHNSGTYHITCTFHPSMQATITVTA